ncbi:MAG: hypothetical protein H0X41_00500 [Chitinophagaceae bacterium]|nr:hypothetical protein [Chitinophagaceae bacterium]
MQQQFRYDAIQASVPGPKPTPEIEPDPATPEIDPPIPPDVTIPDIQLMVL